MTNRTMNLRSLTIGAGLALVLTSCAGSNDTGPTPAPTDVAQTVSPTANAGLPGALGQETGLIIRLPDGTWLVRSRSLGRIFSADGSFREQFTWPSTPREGETGTVLPSGTVLFAGGKDPSGRALATAETWSPQTRVLAALNSTLSMPRAGHHAVLLPSGDVLVWGGAASDSGDLFRSADQVFVPLTSAAVDTMRATLSEPLRLASSTPLAGASNVDPSAWLSVRFTSLLDDGPLTPDTGTLVGPQGPQPVQVTSVEQGREVFAIPAQPLLPKSQYTLFLKGLASENGQTLALVSLQFETGSPMHFAGPGIGSLGTVRVAQPASAPMVPAHTPSRPVFPAGGVSNDPNLWIPQASNFFGRTWFSDAPDAGIGSPPTAPSGTTAVSGRALKLEGSPLAGVTFALGSVSSTSDANGYFLLQAVPPGGQVLEIDGRSADAQDTSYGRFFVHVDLAAGQTTVLPYVVWMARLDPGGTVQIPSPTLQEMVVSTPSIPGLELHLPAGTVIRDHEGKLVTEVNITAIPVNQPPFPLPGFQVPVYFTIQPGGATISGENPSFDGAKLWYPNYLGEVVGAKATFWNYDAVEKGWYPYGLGSVSLDRKQVIPDPGVAIYEFSGAMINGPPPPPPPPPCHSACCGESSGGSSGSGSGSAGGNGGNLQPSGGGASGGGGSSPPEKCQNANSDQGGAGCPQGGEPVILAGGEWTFTETDLQIDDTFPIRLSRTYRSFDVNSRMFGPGMSLSYDIMQYSPNQYQLDEVIQPNGNPIYYYRTTPGNGVSTAVFATDTPGEWGGSTIQWNASISGWDLFFRDGRLWHFGENAPLLYMQDKNGNRLTFTRASGGSGFITRIDSPHGRWVNLTLDPTSGLVTQAQDNIGRTVTYSYSDGGLNSITGADGNVRSYTWGTIPETLSNGGSTNYGLFITNISYADSGAAVQTAYDSYGRVVSQSLADGTSFQYAYPALFTLFDVS